MRLPMLIFRPLPGQEEQNARFLVTSGAAVVTHRTRELRRNLFELLSHPAKLQAMRESAAQIARPRAAESMVATMLGHVAAVQATQRQPLAGAGADPGRGKTSSASAAAQA